MNLTLKRAPSLAGCTIGMLFIDGIFECYSCEDVVRDGPKVPGETAIPAGRYRVIIDFSKRFEKLMPLLLCVPGFAGIRIHTGNTAADTEGCILVGQTIHPNRDGIGGSVAAFQQFFPKLQAALNDSEVWIDIQAAPTATT